MKQQASKVSRPSKRFVDAYTGKIVHAKRSYSHRVCRGIPTTGNPRIEAVHSWFNQVIPCNWSQVDVWRELPVCSPVGYLVADARNFIACDAVERGFDWLWFIDHDVVLSPITIRRWNDMMLTKKVPVWAGLYFTKSVPSEPLIYRGRGNSYYTDWHMGDKVWVDGIPMGNTCIHVSILKAMYQDCEEYTLGGKKVRRIFETPAKVYVDPETQTWAKFTGTEDLNWCDRVMDGDYFTKAGWPRYAGKEYPFLLDTSVYSKHIDNAGNQYPMHGEERQWERNSLKTNPRF